MSCRNRPSMRVCCVNGSSLSSLILSPPPAKFFYTD
nr:MAG TPA: hypothetical protein [Caudoviricetes sp.]